MVADRGGDALEQRHQLRRLVEPMREAGEAVHRLTAIERGEVAVGRRRHPRQHHSDVGHDDVRAPVREGGGDQPRHLLVERVAVT